MSLGVDSEVVPPITAHAPKSGALVRLAAAVGGLAVLAGTAVVSVGTVVIVLIGMAIIAGVQRKRGRALTRSGHWVAACTTMAVVVLAVGAGAYALVPDTARNAAKQSMDSSNAAAAKQPPPAWLERLAPQYRQATTAKPSPALMWISTIFGFGFVVTLLATLLGTLSWGAAMLLGLAAVGRWPGLRGDSFEDLVVDLPVRVT